MRQKWRRRDFLSEISMESKKCYGKSFEWVDHGVMTYGVSQEESLFCLEEKCLCCRNTVADVTEVIFPSQRFFDSGDMEDFGVCGLCKGCINAFLKLVDENRRSVASSLGRKAAYALHSKPGGTYEKHAKLREIFASGKYTSRDVCAEQECAGLDMAFSTARRALRNTPDPT